jgi:hypothetical protein
MYDRKRILEDGGPWAQSDPHDAEEEVALVVQVFSQTLWLIPVTIAPYVE